MILPTKHLSEDRALLAIGAEILRLLDEPKTVSRVWDEINRLRPSSPHSVTYDWFVLALDLLYALEAIDIERGRLRKAGP